MIICLESNLIYQRRAMYASGSTGLQKTWPSKEGVGFPLSQRKRVSLVPKDMAMSPFSKHIPAKEAGLSPVNATTEQEGSKP